MKCNQDITCTCQKCAKRAYDFVKQEPKVFLAVVGVALALKDVEWKHRKVIAKAILLVDFPIDDKECHNAEIQD